MRGTGASALAGTEQFELQLLVKGVSDRLRNDVRTLVRIDAATEHRVAFTVAREDGPAALCWTWDPVARVLRREDSGRPGGAWQAAEAGRIEACRFVIHPDPANFHELELAMRLCAPERPGQPVRRLAVSCRFSSRARERPFAEPD